MYFYAPFPEYFAGWEGYICMISDFYGEEDSRRGFLGYDTGFLEDELVVLLDDLHIRQRYGCRKMAHPLILVCM